MSTPENHLFWIKLDYAGKLFPAQNTEEWSNVIRSTVVLKETVDPAVLTSALSDVMPRFSCFAVRLRKGLFWNYLQQNPVAHPKVMPDINNPCRRMKWHENDGFMFRVFYYENRISVEFFHGITDGYGMTRFVMTLVARYLTLMGTPIPAGGAVLDINEEPRKEELEDSFKKYGNSKGKLPKDKTGVYHFIGTRLPAHNADITTGYISVKQLHAKAKEYGVTITEFLSALMLYVVYKKQEDEPGSLDKYVSVQVPMNARNKLPSVTLRNFSLATFIGVDPKLGKYTFEEVLQILVLNLRGANNEKVFRAMITKNLGIEKNPAVRFTPLLVKNTVVKFLYDVIADNNNSALISNLGKTDVPKEMEEKIERIAYMTSPGRRSGARCAIGSIGDTLSVTFMNIYKEKDIERAFFTELVKMGIHVKIESNYLKEG